MNRLKELRKGKKLTQQELADFIGITRRGYQKWENSESQIKPDKAQTLAEYFGVSVGYLLGYECSSCLSNGTYRKGIEDCIALIDGVWEKAEFFGLYQLSSPYISRGVYPIAIVRFNGRFHDVRRDCIRFEEDL